MEKVFILSLNVIGGAVVELLTSRNGRIKITGILFVTEGTYIKFLYL